MMRCLTNPIIFLAYSLPEMILGLTLVLQIPVLSHLCRGLLRLCLIQCINTDNRGLLNCYSASLSWAKVFNTLKTRCNRRATISTQNTYMMWTFLRLQVSTDTVFHAVTITYAILSAKTVNRSYQSVKVWMKSCKVGQATCCMPQKLNTAASRCTDNVA